MLQSSQQSSFNYNTHQNSDIQFYPDRENTGEKRFNTMPGYDEEDDEYCFRGSQIEEED